MICVLGAIGLFTPIMSALGVFDEGILAKPVGSIVAKVGIGLLWTVVAIVARVKHPVMTLMFAGITYSVFSLALNIVLNVIDYGDAQLFTPYGFITATLLAAAYGALFGSLAWLFGLCRKLRN